DRAGRPLRLHPREQITDHRVGGVDGRHRPERVVEPGEPLEDAEALLAFFEMALGGGVLAEGLRPFVGQPLPYAAADSLHDRSLSGPTERRRASFSASASRARRRCVFTVFTGIPSAAAISASGRLSSDASTRASRWARGSRWISCSSQATVSRASAALSPSGDGSWGSRGGGAPNTISRTLLRRR